MYRYHNGPQRQCRFALSRHIKATNQVNSTICKSVTKCASITQSHNPIQQQYCAFTNATPNRSANGTGSIINPHWKRKESGKFQRPIFVAATRQHVGKTTVSLALVSGLKKRFDKVGFIKPGKGQNRSCLLPMGIKQSGRHTIISRFFFMLICIGHFSSSYVI